MARARPCHLPAGLLPELQRRRRATSTPAGLRVDFDHADSEAVIFQIVYSGDAAELQPLIDADLAVDGCSPYETSFKSPVTVVDHVTPPDADSSAIYFWNRGPVNRGDLVETIVHGKVRYGDTLVSISWSGLNDNDPVTPIPTVEKMAMLLAASAPD